MNTVCMSGRSTCCAYLLVKICWSSERACAVADVGLAAADRDAVVLGLFKPAGVLPVRVVVNAAAVKLGRKVSEILWLQFEMIARATKSHVTATLSPLWACKIICHGGSFFCPHLPLHIINRPAGSVGVSAVVFIVHLLDGVIHLIFDLKWKHSCSYLSAHSRLFKDVNARESLTTLA